MPDAWTMFEQLDADTQERLAGVLETQAADPRQQALRRTFLEGVTFPRSARVLEVGCGTGALTRILAGWAGIDSVVGLDPASALLERARALAGGLGNVTFTEGDARFGSRPRSSTPSCSTRCCPTCRSPSRRSQRRLAGRRGDCSRPQGGGAPAGRGGHLVRVRELRERRRPQARLDD